MRKFLRSIIVIAIICALAIGVHIYYLTTLAAKEKYPADTYLLSENNKTALIIVAHDDDAVGSSGTISMLTENGWKIREMCFYQQGGIYLKKDSTKNPIRKKSFQHAAAIQGFEGIDPVDFNFRNDMNNEQSYLPMPYSDFSKHYKLDSLRQYIAKYIEQYKPSVIFSLDDIMGGYGHPDHTMIGQLVVEYCKLHQRDSGFSVRKIYQPVFPPSLAKSILGKMEVYTTAMKVYQCDGMPAPDVQVNISKYGKQKKAAMATYTTEQNSLKKIWPYYNWYPAWIYFKIFNRDFFRVLEVNAL